MRQWWNISAQQPAIVEVSTTKHKEQCNNNTGVFCQNNTEVKIDSGRNQLAFGYDWW